MQHTGNIPVDLTFLFRARCEMLLVSAPIPRLAVDTTRAQLPFSKRKREWWLVPHPPATGPVEVELMVRVVGVERIRPVRLQAVPDE